MSLLKRAAFHFLPSLPHKSNRFFEQILGNVADWRMLAFGPLRVYATEYSEPVRLKSGEPLGLKWSIWFGFERRLKKGQFEVNGVRWFYGRGGVHHWAKPHHIEFQIWKQRDQGSATALSGVLTEEHGDITLRPPVAFDPGERPILQITAATPHARGQATLRLYFDRSNEPMDLVYRFNFNTPDRLYLAGQPAPWQGTNRYADEHLVAGAFAISLDWKTEPDLTHEQSARLYGEPEWNE